MKKQRHKLKICGIANRIIIGIIVSLIIVGHTLIAKAIFEKIEPEPNKKIQILNEN